MDRHRNPGLAGEHFAGAALYGHGSSTDALPSELRDQFRHRSGYGLFHHPRNEKKKRVGSEQNLKHPHKQEAALGRGRLFVVQKCLQ